MGRWSTCSCPPPTSPRQPPSTRRCSGGQSIREEAASKHPEFLAEGPPGAPPARDAGPVGWILADQLWPLLHRIDSHGGRVAGRPVLDGGERYLVECDDPAGNRIGLAVPVRRLTQ